MPLDGIGNFRTGAAPDWRNVHHTIPPQGDWVGDGMGNLYTATQGLGDYWDIDDHGNPVLLPGNAPTGSLGVPGVGTPVTVSGVVNGQPASGSGHSLQTAWLAFANNVWSGVSQYLNTGRQIQVAQLQATGALGGASGQGLTGFIGQATTWMQQNPIIVAVVIGAVVLYVIPSPRQSSGRR